ncbi:MAG: YoaP domain-containing protein [Dysosmobacter welbionis]
MELVKVTKENLEQEHICCAIANNRDCQVASKKAWLARRFDDGLVFLKGDVRGKCFIEYLPAERAWAPVEAEDCMYIDCLWVSGKLAGTATPPNPLDACIQDSREKGKRGLVILSADKKRPFLSDPGFLEHKGFQAADQTPPYFRLYWLAPWGRGRRPGFSLCQGAKGRQGKRLYPLLHPAVPLHRQIRTPGGGGYPAQDVPSGQYAWRRRNGPEGPTPFTTYSLFYNGRFVTHEILSEKKFDKLLEELAGEEA